MPAPKVLPKYVYKIVDEEPPSPIPDPFPLSELDKQDGFIHLSTSWQIPITASLFFASHTTLWLIKIRYTDDVAAASRWDDPPNENDGCPHLYDRGFGPKDVEGVARFDRGTAADGGESSWKDVFGASKWLE